MILHEAPPSDPDPFEGIEAHRAVEGLPPEAEPDPLAEAIKELQAEGIPTTHANIERWLADHGEAHAGVRLRKALEAQGVRLAEKAVPPKSNTEDEARTPKTTTPKKKPRRGRKPVEPPWLEPLAKLVAYGTPLRQALRRMGIRLSERETQNIYRWVRWRYWYDTYRLQFFREWGLRVSPARWLS